MKKYKDFLVERANVANTNRTGHMSSLGIVDGDGTGNIPKSLYPVSRRSYTYFDYSDFKNMDYQLFQTRLEEEEIKDYGIYEIIIEDIKYILTPLVENKEYCIIDLVDLKEFNTVFNLSSETGTDLKDNEFYLNENEYSSLIIEQLIQQGFVEEIPESKTNTEKYTRIAYRVTSD